MSIFNFFINDAVAEAGSSFGAQPELLSQLMVFGGIFLIFYFLFIRPQNKKLKEHKQMTESLKKGDEIVTNGGVLGKITSLHENFVSIEVAKDINIRVQRQSISTLMPKGTVKAIKD
ncbi:MAG: preprotein translocase subunit YajC [Pseudomonadota bacterium]